MNVTKVENRTIRTTTATLLIGVMMGCVSARAAVLTHGPMVGHTTESTSRIWARADGVCRMHVEVTDASTGQMIASESIRLAQVHNYCGSAEVKGLSPHTMYSYRVLLDGTGQAQVARQTFRTYPKPGARCVVRIGFGHSLRGSGVQTTWNAIAAKEPDLFILMGDNIYSDSTEPAKQRKMYLAYRGDPCFRAFAARTPIYAVWDDHDYGDNNSDRTQDGKERSLRTFHEVWANPAVQTEGGPGIWTRFTAGPAEFFLMDVRYHRSPNADPDNPTKTMLGREQLRWLQSSLADSQATFKFPVSGSSWNCGGPEAWNHTFTHEYDALLNHMAAKRVAGVILLGGDQHTCKIAVRPKESWGGYDLHEWMAGQLWNSERDVERGYAKGFGLITIDATGEPATARLEFFDKEGRPREGRRILYTTLGSLRALLDSPVGATGVAEGDRGYIDRLRPGTSGPLWDIMPATTGEVLSEIDLDWPEKK